MKEAKRILILFFVFLIICSPLILSAVNDTSDTSTSTSSYSSNFVLDQNKLKNGTTCLNEQVGDCSGLSLEEIAFVLLAQPNKTVSDKCLEKLREFKVDDSDCFGQGGCNVKSTALAILALGSAGDNTDKYEKWLLNHTIISEDLDWILMQDSNGETNCKFSYNGEIFETIYRADKKITTAPGECFSKTNDDLWLLVSKDCYDTNFSVACDAEFGGQLDYKSSNGPLIVLSGTKFAPAYGSLDFKIQSKCISTSIDCDYESNLWAITALKKTGNNIDEFLPYLIAVAESNKRYMPNAFIYLIGGESVFAEDLIKEQRLGDYWEANFTPYNKFYDTSLALIALSSDSAPQINNAKGRMMFLQDKTGCWNNNQIRETAMVVGALKGWKIMGGGSSPAPNPNTTTRCETAGFFCVSSTDCSENNTLGNYFCSGLNKICCSVRPVQKTCSELGGKICATDQSCSSSETSAGDTNYCCLENCVQRATTPECEQTSDSYMCLDSCKSNQESTNLECPNNQVCCKPKSVSPSGGSSWLWIIIIAIVLLLAVLAYVFRDKLKLWWFKFRNKVKKEDKPTSPFASALAPRPGFPPIRRPMPIQPVVRRPLPTSSQTQIPPKPGQKKDQMDDVFKKLKDMSK
jgi:hypothetical protein